MTAPQALKAEYRHIPIGELEASPHNQRRRFRGIEELAQSLQKDGVLEPLLARPKADGGYEVLAGERRLRAGRHAQLAELPCLVRDVDDETAFRITVVENLQRDALDPMEEAAGIAAMQERGLNNIQIAEQIGRSPAWVSRRAKLLNLDESWSKLAEEKGSAMALWSVDHWELIARLPKALQKQILNDKKHFFNNRPLTADELRTELGGYTHQIKQAPWKADDATFAGCPACSACPQRSDCQPELFDDLHSVDESGLTKDARCLDLTCWDKKRAEHVARKIKSQLAKSDRVVVSSDLKRKGIDVAVEGVRQVASWSVRNVAKGETPDCVLIDEQGRARKVRFYSEHENPWREKPKGERGTDGKDKAARAQEKYESKLVEAERVRRNWMVSVIGTEQGRWNISVEAAERLAALAIMSLQHYNPEIAAPDLDALKGPIRDLDFAPMLMRPGVIEGLLDSDYAGLDNAYVLFIAEQLGLDHATLEAAALEQHPDPAPPKPPKSEAKPKAKSAKTKAANKA